MNPIPRALVCGLLLTSVSVFAQDGDLENIVVTGSRISGYGRDGIVPVVEPRPVIGIRRQADSAIRNVEITSDSLDEGMRRREVRAMLLDAIDRAERQGFNIVTGQFTVTDVTRANWQDLFPDLARGSASDYSDDDESWQNDDDDDDDYDDEEDARPTFEDDGRKTILRLMVKTKLEGTIDEAARKITAFVKSVPETGRSQMKQRGAMALTIIKPEQYRDEIYRMVAEGAQHAVSFYGPEYGLEVSGLGGSVAWEQVSDTELFVFIRYNFVVRK
ncbi:MAG: hypothetical protein H6978_12255 [Gammaproteobacteria bacterium]|nr:hypothetical protein [Gammaproteobacteria bacterium]